MDFLARLVEGEAALRQDRARQRRIQQARFPVLKTLEQFDFTWPTKINRLAVQNLFRLKFIEDKANAILIGGVGLGKSHLAIALGYAACQAGFRVRFTTAIDIINTLSAAQNAGRLVQELKKYTRPDLLVIDELGLSAHRQARGRPALPDHQPTLRTRLHRPDHQQGLQALAVHLQQRQHPDLGHPRPHPPPRRDHRHRRQKLPHEGPHRALRPPRTRQSSPSGDVRSDPPSRRKIKPAVLRHVHAGADTASMSARNPV